MWETDPIRWLQNTWLTEKGYSVWLQSTCTQQDVPQQCLSCMRWDQWRTQSDHRSPIDWSPDIWNSMVQINKHFMLICNDYNNFLLHSKVTRVSSISTLNKLLLNGHSLSVSVVLQNFKMIAWYIHFGLSNIWGLPWKNVLSCAVSSMHSFSDINYKENNVTEIKKSVCSGSSWYSMYA